MGAHLYVRAPPPPPPSSTTTITATTTTATSMLARSIILFLFFLMITISTAIPLNGSDSETLIEFKDSLINGDNLTTWTNTNTPCNNNRPNWEGLLCTNGNIWGIKLEGKGLEGSIDPTILARLPFLVSISFKNNSLEGSLPDFRKLDGMREIFLSNNKFYGEIRANAFNGLNRLTKLYLANNELMGHIPLSLTTLPKLKELVLDNNHFDGEIPNFEIGKLITANFANNHLHGRIPEGLRNFPSQGALMSYNSAKTGRITLHWFGCVARA